MKTKEVVSIISKIVNAGTELITFSKKYKLTKKNFDNNHRKYSTLYVMDKELNNFEEQENIKYGMFCNCLDKEDEDFTELHIVIGQNPSHSSKKNVDKTNQNIFKALITQEIYHYLLFNTFPVIDPDGSNSMSDLKVEENRIFFEKVIKEIIEIKEKVKIKLIYACGTSLPVYYPFIELVKKMADEYGLETLAFTYGDDDEEDINSKLQSHMSMQSCNKCNRTDYTKFALSPFTINKSKNDCFTVVTFTYIK